MDLLLVVYINSVLRYVGDLKFSFIPNFIAYRYILSKMEVGSFETKLLIDEIEKRPAIWYITSQIYSNKMFNKIVKTFWFVCS